MSGHRLAIGADIRYDFYFSQDYYFLLQESSLNGTCLESNFKLCLFLLIFAERVFCLQRLRPSIRLTKIAELRLCLAAALRKMFQLKAASALAWPLIKKETEQILYELGASIKNMFVEKDILLTEKPHLEC